MPKTVLITGSTSGIGLGIAHQFAAAGYAVMLNGLEKNGQEIADSLSKQYNIPVLFHGGNMLVPSDLKDMVEQMLSAWKQIDVLVCNAGIQHVSPIETFPEDKWDAIIGINLSSAFHLTKAVWPSMKERKFGRIIHIASAHGLMASEFKSAYVAAKHGLVGLTKVTALEGAPFNITCNAICPGYVKTPLVEQQIESQALAHGISPEEVVQKVMLHKQAVKQFVPVETLGQLALFLASEGATTLTGTALPIDGGWFAQ